MHCILQGVQKDVLEQQVRNLSKSQKQSLTEIIDNLHARAHENLVPIMINSSSLRPTISQSE